jgi:hypothetical protein
MTESAAKSNDKNDAPAKYNALLGPINLTLAKEK